MATPNVGILTTAGKALIDKVNSGQAKISFSKVVFSSMDNSQLSDTQVKALTAISPQEVIVSPPETTLDTASGETRIRATGTNKQLAVGVYVKTYGVFAKDDTGNEILYGVTVSPNPNYFPAYDGVTPQAVTYSYKTVIQETSNITMTNSNDVYVSQEDLTEAIAAIPLATKADDSKVVHNSGNEEIAGQKTFDVAPIDKTTGNPYITKSDLNNGLSAKVNTADMRKPASDVVGLDEIKSSLLPNGTDLYTLINTSGKPLSYHASTYVSAQSMVNKPTTKLSAFKLSTASIGDTTSSSYNYTLLTLKDNSDGSIYEALLNTDVSGAITVVKPWYKVANDSTVVHNSGNEEIAGQKTFDTAPIDKTTGNPYITKDGVPAVPSTLADTTKDANFTGKLQKSGIDVATKSDVTTAVSTATANMVDSSKPTNFTAGLKSGGVDVATAADLKSIEPIPNDLASQIKAKGWSVGKVIVLVDSKDTATTLSSKYPNIQFEWSE